MRESDVAISSGSAGDRMLPGKYGMYRLMFVACIAGFILATLFTAIAAAQTVPETTIFLNGTRGNGGWFTSDVTVTLEAMDFSGLGINRTEYSFSGSEGSWKRYTGPFTISEEGMTAVYYRSIDNGSAAEPAKMDLVSIDKTSPAIVYTLTPSPNANGWTTRDVRLHFEVSDDVSGVAIRPGDLTLTNEYFYSSLTGTAMDSAGNIASVAIPAFGIDRTPPVVGNLTVQSNACVGDYLPVSAYVAEANPERIEWDFGDGTGMMATVGNDNVARTSHAYRQPGPYRITLNVIDLAGNAARSTATVTIYGTARTSPATPVPTPAPEPTATPTQVPLPSATPKPATPAPGIVLVSIALIGGAMLLAGTRKR